MVGTRNRVQLHSIITLLVFDIASSDLRPSSGAQIAAKVKCLFRCRWACWEGDIVASVESPGERIELEVCLTNLTLGCNGEQVEALDFIHCAADAKEVPVPQDLVAASNEHFDCVDAHDGRSSEGAGDVELLAGESDTAQRETLQGQNGVGCLLVVVAEDSLGSNVGCTKV